MTTAAMWRAGMEAVFSGIVCGGPTVVIMRSQARALMFRDCFFPKNWFILR
jgi:hypothetical protein